MTFFNVGFQLDFYKKFCSVKGKDHVSKKIAGFFAQNFQVFSSKSYDFHSICYKSGISEIKSSKSSETNKISVFSFLSNISGWFLLQKSFRKYLLLFSTIVFFFLSFTLQKIGILSCLELLCLGPQQILIQELRSIFFV